LNEKIKLIEEGIIYCDGCSLLKNTHIIPKYTEKVKYIMLTEHPYKDEPDFMKEFWNLSYHYGFTREDFLQIGTVQCLPNINKRTKRYNRPSKVHRNSCKKWFNLYVDEIKPNKILAFGNIPMEELTGDFSGITKHHAEIVKLKINNVVIPTVLSLPPSILKTDKNGKEKIRQTLSKFKEI